MVVTLGQQYNVGEKPTVILYTYINHHAQPPIITHHNHCYIVTRIVLMSTIVSSNHTRIGAWVNSKMCVCVLSSHSFWTSSSLDVPAGVTQEEGHTGFLFHLLPAVRALIFLARRIQPLGRNPLVYCTISLTDMQGYRTNTEDAGSLGYNSGLLHYI